jgi:hypothetical protein
VYSLPGRGTWKANVGGKKVKFTVTNFSSNGSSYTARGSVTALGRNIKIRITFSDPDVAPGSPTSGIYRYTGSR